MDIKRERKKKKYTDFRRKVVRSVSNCTYCGISFFGSRMRELDHIVPAVAAPERFYDKSNVQVLCKDCHQLKTNSEIRVLGKKKTPLGYMMGSESDGTPIWAETLIGALEIARKRVEKQIRKSAGTRIRRPYVHPGRVLFP